MTPQHRIHSTLSRMVSRAKKGDKVIAALELQTLHMQIDAMARELGIYGVLRDVDMSEGEAV